jgi:hypothetical protein
VIIQENRIEEAKKVKSGTIYSYLSAAEENNIEIMGLEYSINANVAGIAKNIVNLIDVLVIYVCSVPDSLSIAEDNSGIKASEIGLNNDGTRLKIGITTVEYIPNISLATPDVYPISCNLRIINVISIIFVRLIITALIVIGIAIFKIRLFVLSDFSHRSQWLRKPSGMVDLSHIFFVITRYKVDKNIPSEKPSAA